MFNLGASEIVLIVVLALVFIGPKKLPEMAAGLGKMIRELRKTTADIKSEIEIDDAIRKPFEELRDAVTLAPEELKRIDFQRALQEAREKAEREAEKLIAEAGASEKTETMEPSLAGGGPGTETGFGSEAAPVSPVSPVASAVAGVVPRKIPEPTIIGVPPVIDKAGVPATGAPVAIAGAPGVPAAPSSPPAPFGSRLPPPPGRPLPSPIPPPPKPDKA